VRIVANAAEAVTLKLPVEARPVAAGVPDFMRRFGQGSANDPFWLRCQGRSCDGAVFDLLVATQEPVELTLIGLHRGLPEEAALLVAARPEHARPQYVIDGRYTVRRARL
jgi:hypothetical protein